MHRLSTCARRAAAAAVAIATFTLAGLFSAASAQDISTTSSATAPLDLSNINVAAADPAQDLNKHLTVRDSLITIDASLEDQFPLGGDQRVHAGSTTNQIVYAGTARLRLWPGIAVFYRRINHDNVSGATNGTSYGSFGYDIEGDYGIEYAANKNLRFESFWKYRYRTCCPNAADATAFSTTAKTPAGPRAERGYINNVTYRFGPNTRIGRSFLVSEEAQLYEHHLDDTIMYNPTFIKAGGLLNGLPNASDSTMLFETHVYYYMSIFGQRKVVPYVGWENKPSYFDNTTQPNFMNRIRYGATIKLSPVFGLDAFVKNDHSYPASATGAHNTTLFTDLLIHLKS
jgi:hypothetical protein